MTTEEIIKLKAINFFFSSRKDSKHLKIARLGFEEGYKRALKDYKQKELIEMLEYFVNEFEDLYHKGTDIDNKISEAKQLIKIVKSL